MHYAGHCSWAGTGACAFDPWATELTKDVAALYGDIQSSSQVPWWLQSWLFALYGDR